MGIDRVRWVEGEEVEGETGRDLIYAVCGRQAKSPCSVGDSDNISVTIEGLRRGWKVLQK
jgi:hypothetical protein